MKYKKIGEIRAHRVIAEKVLGRFLKDKELVHHVDGDGTNNVHTNLVICPDPLYHQLLHTRTTALLEGGNANFKKCIYCKTWDWPEEMTQTIRSENSSRPGAGNFFYHKLCATINYKLNRARILENRNVRRAGGGVN